jgi:5-methylcytosine-specific restriction endonuclease McrA
MAFHRRPEIPFSDAPRGVCRWCGDAILQEDGPKRGERNLRRRWHPACLLAWEQSDPREARRRVRRRDRGICADCGLDTYATRRQLRGRGSTARLRERGFKPRKSLWELDHIVPLIDGGSHDMANLQTLCTPCHKRKTAREASHRRERERERQAEALMERAELLLESSRRLVDQLGDDERAR